jgi:hypothetical protein
MQGGWAAMEVCKARPLQAQASSCERPEIQSTWQDVHIFTFLRKRWRIMLLVALRINQASFDGHHLQTEVACLLNSGASEAGSTSKLNGYGLHLCCIYRILTKHYRAREPFFVGCW